VSSTPRGLFFDFSGSNASALPFPLNTGLLNGVSTLLLGRQPAEMFNIIPDAILQPKGFQILPGTMILREAEELGQLG
jgi:hypothetical protein